MSVAILLGEQSTNGRIWGVIDHNTFTGANNFMGVGLLGGGETDWVTGLQGGAHNLFVEDNTFTFTTQADPGTGCIDAWSGGAIVFRHNTGSNCRAIVHGVCHNGPSNFEVYNNNISTADGYRLIHHQGSGEFMVFNNSLSKDHIALMYYRSEQQACPSFCDGTAPIDGNNSSKGTHGYPCYRQPGRDVTGTLRPVYLWNNTVGATQATITIELGSDTYHIWPNRDYYLSVSKNAQTSPTSPFNGTTGMGFGTLANRPTTCTTNALESGGGVGYFATDQGPQGTLYRCSSTNTWIAHYAPYTYPHPLTQGKISPPSIPQGFRISQ